MTTERDDHQGRANASSQLITSDMMGFRCYTIGMSKVVLEQIPHCLI